MIQLLIPDILCYIFSYLTLKQLIIVTKINKFFKNSVIDYLHIRYSRHIQNISKYWINHQKKCYHTTKTKITQSLTKHKKVYDQTNYRYCYVFTLQHKHFQYISSIEVKGPHRNIVIEETRNNKIRKIKEFIYFYSDYIKPKYRLIHLNTLYNRNNLITITIDKESSFKDIYLNVFGYR